MKEHGMATEVLTNPVSADAVSGLVAEFRRELDLVELHYRVIDGAGRRIPGRGFKGARKGLDGVSRLRAKLAVAADEIRRDEALGN